MMMIVARDFAAFQARDGDEPLPPEIHHVFPFFIFLFPPFGVCMDVVHSSMAAPTAGL